MGYKMQIDAMGITKPRFKSWQSLAKVPGPGILKGIGVARSDERDHHIKIEHDGSVIVEELMGASHPNATGFENVGLTFDVPFDGKLEVFAKDKPWVSRSNNPAHRYWITFATGYQPVKTVDDEDE